MPDLVLIAPLLLLCVADCTIPLRCGPETPVVPSHDGASLDSRLVRCGALGAAAHDDPDCESAFAEARRRILPTPAEK